MKRYYTQLATCCLAAAVAFQAGCSQSMPEPDMDQMSTAGVSLQPTKDQESQVLAAGSPEADSITLPKAGERIAGFTVVDLGRIEELGADTILFLHEQSGAELLYIKNDDTNLGFNIGYRTPYIDETDTNHIFEHAIIASSEKYPSTNLFFDLAGKSYHTFINAFTFPAFTCYPFSTQSEEQYMKLMDVYLSCMVAPDILTDENIYKREALRFELDDRDSPITMHGTVFSEDYGYLTDIDSNAESDILKALYPGLTASNSIGRLHRNYQDLTYEKTKATYDRCYHFDNSLLLLYGDMDYVKMLSFIDSEYLSKAAKNHTDLSSYIEETVAGGHVEARTESPAYIGDTTEQAAVISYGIDLSDSAWSDILTWDILTDILASENSLLFTNGQKEGISNRIESYIDYYHQKPYLRFVLADTDESQKDAFMRAVNNTLQQIADEGIDENIIIPYLKADKIQRYTARDNMDAGIDATTYILNYWAHTGSTGIYQVADSSLEAVSNEHSQEQFKTLAAGVLTPQRSALIVTVPAPGLAEQLEAEQEQYLADMKAGMTEKELAELIQETVDFRVWNENERRNNEIAIEPVDLPEPDEYSDYQKTQFEDLISYTAPVRIDYAAAGNVYFDVSEIPVEDIYYLPVFQLLIGRLGTESHSAEEVRNLMMQYLAEGSFTDVYPENQAGDNARPMTRFGWLCLTEDYEQSIDLLIEIMGATDFDDIENIKILLSRYLPYYDQSRYGDRMGQASARAIGYFDRSTAFANAVNSQELYWFMKDVLHRLEEDPEYAAEFTAKMNRISDCILNRKDMIVMNAAAPDQLARIEQAAVEHLHKLPSRERQSQDYTEFIAGSQKTAICVEDSMQYHVVAADMGDQTIISGQDLVYLAAASDKYITPVLRFQNGAYSAAGSFSNTRNTCMMYTYSDPNIESTLEVFNGLGNYLRSADISQAELNGYILNAYAAASTPWGIFDHQILAMANDVNGVDMQMVVGRMNQIKSVTLDDQQSAAKALEDIFRNGAVATVGNQRKIEEAKGCYNEIINYKQVN